MKKLLVLLALMILAIPFAYSSDCETAIDAMQIDRNIVFCSDTFDVPNSISAIADNIEIDCGTGILRGIDAEGTGILIENRKNVTVKNCNIIGFNRAVYLKNSTNCLIEENSFLNNKIGVRLVESFENIITKNNDKSNLKPVGSISSKFNIYDFGNKRIDREFCVDNLCNKKGKIDPCADDDFYCSSKCSAENDNDCTNKATASEITQEPEKEAKDEAKNETAEEPAEETEKEGTPEGNETSMQAAGEKEEMRLRRYTLYILVYLIAFFAIQFWNYVREFDKEDISKD